MIADPAARTVLYDAATALGMKRMSRKEKDDLQRRLLWLLGDDKKKATNDR